MMNTWQLQEAKNKFSEVVEAALSYKEYRKLSLIQQKLSEFFHKSPLAGAGIVLTRDDSPLRDDIEL